MIQDDTKPGIEEQYTTASNTSNLRVEADRKGSGDILIAAGWNASRIGSAVLRLHTDWDRAEKPARLGKVAIAQLAARLHAEDQHDQAAARSAGKEPKPPEIPAATRAHNMVHEWYFNEVAALIGKLHSLPEVHLQLTLQAMRWRFEDAETKAAAIIRWWLNQKCPICNGTKLQVVEGTGRLSGKLCKGCAGSGERVLPFGGEGKQLANFLDQCVDRARISISRRLRDFKSGA